ncbi:MULTISPECIES: 4'-phosphopantetheinyl transferase family protein [Actinoalloteichus]|uniref:Phosphopantetheinyl transferase component of siderophore synthetase n=1 Tax=Actinoalloteichus fjordicus TaxID=1612552 RepID=A0AAC9PSK7_9PSEU|nr:MULTISPECIES: 4'-phosphopantetheinyl transferase superfamily protein [Actinoalloteichus]APU14946.1 phosphopantetheinyl transferase component of siderophore synthetase [Actinoalloteichus fjordicus]APU21016.1 phosphopantetheinyl transferase component of siderophore synthetase [Actinoalloteichus sp. GBA129-24]
MKLAAEPRPAERELVIEKILPSEVVAVERRDDPPEATLFPAEEAVVAAAVDKRRREFRTVRHCARLALAELGLPPAPLLPGERGAPVWPARIVGSMTHCAGYRAAAVARTSAVVSVGIDAEPHDRLPEGVLAAIALPAECDRHATLARTAQGVHWDRILFSAKESVYKTWFPLTGRWLGFEEADITIEPDTGTFRARLLVPGHTRDGGELTGFTGRWLVDDGLVITAIAVLPEESAHREDGS